MELIPGDITFEDEEHLTMSFEDRKRKFSKLYQKEQLLEVAPVPSRLTRDLPVLALSQLDAYETRICTLGDNISYLYLSTIGSLAHFKFISFFSKIRTYDWIL